MHKQCSNNIHRLFKQITHNLTALTLLFSFLPIAFQFYPYEHGIDTVIIKLYIQSCILRFIFNICKQIHIFPNVFFVNITN